MLDFLIASATAEEVGEGVVHEMSLLHDPTFWVMIAFFLFLGVLAYFRVYRTMVEALDKRSAQIAAQLDEARRLKEEAQHLLAQNQRRQREAVREAKAILEHAEEEAAIIAKGARADVDALIERRTRLAQERIAQAEAAAVKEVRAAAVEVATAAAANVIAQNLSAEQRKALADEAIVQLSKKLH